jgi:Lrp/AsnC family transcriptional regulator, leucine-responsive regulatory protein
MSETIGTAPTDAMKTKQSTAHRAGSLDDVDRRILEILQTDGRLSGTDIGRAVHLSQPAVSARIQRLERAGAIKGYRAVVDPASIGLNIHAIVRVRTPHARIAEALEVFEKLREVTTAYRLTGEDCFLLDVHAADAGRLEEVVDAVGRLGPVVTSLVLRDYLHKSLPAATEGT